MDQRKAGVLGFFLLFIPFSIMIIGCPAANNPAAPAGPANTATATFTQACFTGASPTCTPTFTATFTHTFTHTSTPCPNTPTVTATVAYTDYVTGTASYTGSTGTVSGTHPVAVIAFTSSSLNTSPASFQNVTTNGGTYSLHIAAPGTLYLIAMFDYPGAGPYDNFPVGSPYIINGGAAGGCSPPASGTAIAGTTAGPNFSFGDTCRVPGIYGMATYNGSMGSVNYCRQILIKSFTDAAYTTDANNDGTQVSTNGGRYDHNTFSSGPTTPIYLRAVYDANGDGNPTSGEPYSNRGLLTPNATGGLLHTFTFGDSTLLP